MNQRAKRYLAIGTLGVVIALLALAAGLVARRGTTPAAAVPADQGVAVPVNPPGASDPAYRLSSPNERDPGGAALPSDGAAASAPTDLVHWLEQAQQAHAPVPASPAGSGGQQAHLRGIEVRDNGEGATGGDSGPCPPLQLCP